MGEWGRVGSLRLARSFVGMFTASPTPSAFSLSSSDTLSSYEPDSLTSTSLSSSRIDLDKIEAVPGLCFSTLET